MLGLRDVSRSDFIVSDDGSLVLLETAPGVSVDEVVAIREDMLEEGDAPD